MKRSKNIFKQKLNENELKAIKGGTMWKCNQEMPDYIKKRPNSCTYYAWLMANCEAVESCTPTTWNPCYS